MKAIVTKYHGYTDNRGSRISATAEGGNRVVVPYDHSASNPHAQAALALCAKVGWEGDLIEGGLPNGDNVYVFAGSERIPNPTQDARRLAKRNT